MFNDYFKHVGFIRLKLFIFNGVVWNSLLVMFLGVVMFMFVSYIIKLFYFLNSLFKEC